MARSTQAAVPAVAPAVAKGGDGGGTAAAAVGSDGPLGVPDPLGLPGDFWRISWQQAPRHLRPPPGQPNRLQPLMDWDAGDFSRLMGGDYDLELGRNAKFVLDGRKGKAKAGIKLTNEMAKEMYLKRATLGNPERLRTELWPAIR